MEITANQIKELRQITGVSMQACKNALAEADGNIEKAVENLRKRGEAKATEKSSRTTNQGVVESYIHSNKKIGAMVEVLCETDFVARNEDYVAFAKDVAMHITAMNPAVLSPEEISEELIAKEKEIWKELLKNEGKPENIWDNIIAGKEKKFREESALLKQKFVKDPDITIEKLLLDLTNKLGENIKISKFARFEI
ncbi:elongation factor Ts [Patescibacteria group bacterium]|nr:elongation factor Ts [Patescibacteria group bacterium]